MRLNLDLTQNNGIKNVFFSSDLHLFHKNVLKFDKRPFTDVYEMHESLVERWNEVVSKNDVVIYLGDLSFAKRSDLDEVKNIINNLNGVIHYVIGNHDDSNEIKKTGRFASINDYLEVNITYTPTIGLKTKQLFCCMHYPIYSWNKAHYGSIMCHGHCHGNLHHGEDASFYHNRKVIDVGCMLHEYKPISYLDIIKKFTN